MRHKSESRSVAFDSGLGNKGNRFRLSENESLKRKLRNKKEETVERWRKIHNEELRNLYCSDYIVSVITCMTIWVGHLAWVREMDANKIFVG
jgi:hypothetical protein